VPEIKPAEATSVVVQRGSNTVKLKERKITGSKVCHSLNEMRLLVIMQSDCSGFDVVWAGSPYLIHLECGRLASQQSDALLVYNLITRARFVYTVCKGPGVA
jgi:hypothetical protein